MRTLVWLALLATTSLLAREPHRQLQAPARDAARLAVARDAAEAGNWALFARTLKAVWQAPDGYVFRDSRWISTHADAEALLLSRPEGLRAYRDTFAVESAGALAAARDSSSPAKLAEVVTLYRHTDAGLDAERRLAAHYLFAEYFDHAATLYERLLARGDLPAQLLPELRFRLALAQRGAGRESDATWTFAFLAKSLPDGHLPWSIGDTTHRIALPHAKAKLDSIESMKTLSAEHAAGLIRRFFGPEGEALPELFNDIGLRTLSRVLHGRDSDLAADLGQRCRETQLGPDVDAPPNPVFKTVAGKLALVDFKAGGPNQTRIERGPTPAGPTILVGAKSAVELLPFWSALSTVSENGSRGAVIDRSAYRVVVSGLDPASRRQINPGGVPNYISLSAEGGHLTVECTDGTDSHLTLWDAGSGRNLPLSPPVYPSLGSTYALSRNGRRLAVYDGGKHTIYTLENGEYRGFPLSVPTGAARILGFTDTGDVIVHRGFDLCRIALEAPALLPPLGSPPIPTAATQPVPREGH